jgi:hypothetical protein
MVEVLAACSLAAGDQHPRLTTTVSVDLALLDDTLATMALLHQGSS